MEQIEKNRTTNTGFASGGVTCKLAAFCRYSSVVQVDSFVFRNPLLRQAANRYLQVAIVTGGVIILVLLLTT